MATYSSYLRIPELLSCQQPQTEAHDELLFITIHQAHEVWFKLVLHELTDARDALVAADVLRCCQRLRRSSATFRVLTHQWEVLDTMRPSGYLEFRYALEGGSGFQSSQFREIEFLCSGGDAGYLDSPWLSEGERERLVARTSAPTIRAAYLALLETAGLDVPAVIANASGRADLEELSECLVELDTSVAAWRTRHSIAVERQIGHKRGTGGSAGTSYLREVATNRYFPELWRARTELRGQEPPTR